MQTLNLLGTTSRVEVPFVKVTIGEYTFGVYDKKTSSGYDVYGSYKLNKITYPNYIQSLRVQKINGVVNTYTLAIEYPITKDNDPNFFEKVFGSVSKTRKIIFSYGDLSTPSFCYRDEEAIITKVNSSVNINSAVISYTVSAISTGKLASHGSWDFPETYAKPSDVIKRILYTPQYGLLELFYGMSDRDLIEQSGLIAGDDVKVHIEAKNNISILDYLTFLVSCMTDVNSGTSIIRRSFYMLTIIDDTSGKFLGPYFKVTKASSIKDIPTAYEIDIGFPDENIVTDFRIENDDSYSIIYEYNDQLHSENYVQRINDNGEIEEIYAPVITSGTADKRTHESEKTWWTKVTEFPIRVSMTLKGLLRPAILMTYVRLNVYFFGRRHISSGLYIVTKQIDSIGTNGFRTSLTLNRVGKADPLKEGE